MPNAPSNTSLSTTPPYLRPLSLPPCTHPRSSLATTPHCHLLARCATPPPMLPAPTLPLPHKPPAHPPPILVAFKHYISMTHAPAHPRPPARASPARNISSRDPTPLQLPSVPARGRYRPHRAAYEACSGPIAPSEPLTRCTEDSVLLPVGKPQAGQGGTAGRDRRTPHGAIVMRSQPRNERQLPALPYSHRHDVGGEGGREAGEGEAKWRADGEEGPTLESSPRGSLVSWRLTRACRGSRLEGGSFDGRDSLPYINSLVFCTVLVERLAWLAYQTQVVAFFSLYEQCDQGVVNSENWLKVQQPPSCEPDPLRIQLERCREELARLLALQPQVELLGERLQALKEFKESEEDPSAFLDTDVSALEEHYQEVLEELRARERQLTLVLESLPPARYKETISTLLAWLQQCEAKLAIPSTAVTEYPIMEQRLRDVRVLQGALTEHQGEVDYLTAAVEQVFQKAPADISQRYRLEMDAIMARWKRLAATLDDNAQKIQELMAKLMQFENDVTTLKKWMADVDVFLNEEWPALGDSEALEKQLEQCTALVNDIHTIQPSLNGINEVGLHLKKEAEPLFAVHIQKELDDLNGQWEMVCKQAYAKKCALKGGLDKTMALRKEMREMQEWINQAEEDYLERDFTYKTPEELRRAVEELKAGSFDGPGKLLLLAQPGVKQTLQGGGRGGGGGGGQRKEEEEEGEGEEEEVEEEEEKGEKRRVEEGEEERRGNEERHRTKGVEKGVASDEGGGGGGGHESNAP
ncbi:unnamed protein product [Gadus morhua 'NCC']